MKSKYIAFEVSRDEHYKSNFLKSLKEDWPSMAKDYRHYCHQDHPETGAVWIWSSSEGAQYVHMILDESTPAKHDDHRLAAFKKALKALDKKIGSEALKTVEFRREAFSMSDAEWAQAMTYVKAYDSSAQAQA